MIELVECLFLMKLRIRFMFLKSILNYLRCLIYVLKLGALIAMMYYGINSATCLSSPQMCNDSKKQIWLGLFCGMFFFIEKLSDIRFISLS